MSKRNRKRDRKDTGIEMGENYINSKDANDFICDDDDCSEVNFMNTASEKLEMALVNLQPIRDLARNWDIDVASFLDDYLQELVHISARNTNISLDRTNFAQAALLLQNSSHIYSRKVEYLHSLVYSTMAALEAYTTTKGATQSGRNENKPPNSVQLFQEFDPHVEFLLMDKQILPIFDHKHLHKINLDYSNYCVDAVDAKRGTPSEAVTIESEIVDNSIACYETSRLSLGDSLSVSRNITSHEKTGTGVSFTNDITPGTSAAVKSLLGSLIQDVNVGNPSKDGLAGCSTGTMRLVGGRCDIGNDGMLVIPGSYIWDDTKMFYSHDCFLDEPDDTKENEDNMSQASVVDNGSASLGLIEREVKNDSVNEESDNASAFLDRDDEENSYAMENEATYLCYIDSTTPALSSDPDLWRLLDPHSDASKANPLKIATTYLLPKELTVPPADCVTGARTKYNYLRRIQTDRQNKQQQNTNFNVQRQAVTTFENLIRNTQMNTRDDENCKNISFAGNVSIVERCMAVSPRVKNNSLLAKTMKQSPIPLNGGLFYGNEFLYISKEKKKQKAAERRKKQLIVEKLEDDNNLVVALTKEIEQEEQLVMTEYLGDESVGYDFDFHDDHIISKHPSVHDSLKRGGSQGSSDSDMSESLNHLFNCDNSNTAFGYIEKDKFEELCRAHVRAFTSGSEQYAVDTKLSLRVGEWQNRLAPILAAEENRNEFDIYEYGNCLMNSMKKGLNAKSEDREDEIGKIKPTKAVDFQSITADKEPHDVCRLFLASLMLTNSGNISLSDDCSENDNDQRSFDILQIELLKEKVESITYGNK